MIAFFTLVRKEITRVLRIWVQSIVPPVITGVLYFIIFGQIIGERVGHIGDVPYIRFIIPGMIMLSIITNAFTNVASSFFGNKFQKSIEEILVSPMGHKTIITGYCIGGVFRSLLVGTCIYLVSLIFEPYECSHPLLAFVFAFLTALFFSLAGFFNGIFAKSFDDVAIVPEFIIRPMIYLGGVFYSVDMLPSFFKGLSLLTPIFYMVEGLRYSFLGQSILSPLYGISILLVAILLLFIINYRLLKHRVGF